MRGASLTRRVRFTATHRYWRPEWDEARNVAVFGACAAPLPHAHDYTCDVTVAGAVDAQTGMVLDLGVLDAILDAAVVRPLHGHSVNDALPEFAAGGLIPTCEELARVIAGRVATALAAAPPTALPTAPPTALPTSLPTSLTTQPGAVSVRHVRVAEDDSLSATWSAGSSGSDD